MKSSKMIAVPLVGLLVLTWICASLFHPLLVASESPGHRERLSLDSGWRFHLGNDWGSGQDLAKAGSSSGPASASFADVGWRTINLPHDWAVELPFDPKADGSHGFKPLGPGFSQNNVGWYRRSFPLPKQDAGKRIWIEFDGAYRDSLVYVNGYFIGRNESGYSGFRYDITDVVDCGGRNVVAVRIDASQFEGWFYEGAGIYRHAWLVKTSPLAIAPDSIFVYPRFKANGPDTKVELHLAARLKNAQDRPALASVKCEILDPEGKSVGAVEQDQRLDSWSEGELKTTVSLKEPVLWSPESPKLYRLVTTVESSGQIVDRVSTEFGVRSASFDPEQGFLLNGRVYELKGTCNHQDHAGVGAALPDRLQYFRVQRLKEMGCNAYRSSHNPPTPELLEACDRLGMLVMDENRLLGSDPANLDRLERLVRRDRNHPSVVVWSIANEEGVQTTPSGARVAQTMQRLIHRLDPTRQVTMAANVGNDFAGLNRIIDVRGWNYNLGPDMDQYHAAHPAQPNVGTEQASTVCTRGIYANDKERGYVSAYDDNAPPWAHTTETWWKFFAARPWLAGGFAWTGFDYRGEPTPYGWPCISSHFGILDTCGFPKDNFYYYQAWWTEHPMVHLLPHWTWPGKDGQEIDVRCFSNCDEVELMLNGLGLGKLSMPRNSHLRWKVKYAPGVLSAKGFRGGQLVAEDRVETAGAPTALRLTPDRPAINADGQDASLISVAVVDAQGRIVPVAGNLVHFELSGPGKIIGVGNGDPSCHEPDVYVSWAPPRSVLLNEWHMKEVPNPEERPEVAKAFGDRDWRQVDTGAALGPLNPGQSAVFRTHFIAKAKDLEARSLMISFGMIDDEGWIYVNGHLIGESHEWSASPVFEIRKSLQPGDNTIAVVVKNNQSQGGLNKGVTLEIQDKLIPADWKRSTFNGLAQIIVQSTEDPGELKLTARADGLTPSTLSVSALSRAARPTVP